MPTMGVWSLVDAPSFLGVSITEISLPVWGVRLLVDAPLLILGVAVAELTVLTSGGEA